MKPIQYYRMMRRRFKYSPRNAALSTLMNYCAHRDEFWKRAVRISRVLNKFDKERKRK